MLEENHKIGVNFPPLVWHGGYPEAPLFFCRYINKNKGKKKTSSKSKDPAARKDEEAFEAQQSDGKFPVAYCAACECMLYPKQDDFFNFIYGIGEGVPGQKLQRRRDDGPGPAPPELTAEFTLWLMEVHKEHDSHKSAVDKWVARGSPMPKVNPADAQHGEWEKIPEKVLVDWDIDMSGDIFIAASKGRKKYKELCQKVDTLGWWNIEDAKYKQDVGRENPEYKLKKNSTSEIFGHCEMRFFRANLVFN